MSDESYLIHPEQALEDYQAFDSRGRIVPITDMTRDELLRLSATLMDRVDEIEEAMESHTARISDALDKYRWGR